MRNHRVLAGLAIALCLVATGCARRPSTAPAALPALRPAATFPVDVGRVEYVEAHAGNILVANVATSTVELTKADGHRLFLRSFPGTTLASLRLSTTGDRVFVSLMREDGSDPSALWLDETGKTLWQRSGRLKTGLYDANIAADGRSLQLVTLASGTSPTGVPDFELVSDAGRTLSVSTVSRAAVSSVQASPDLSRTVVTSLIATDTSGETPPTTIVERFAGARRLDSLRYPQMQGSVYLSPSGALLSTVGGSTLSLRSWDSTAPVWKRSAPGVSVVTFSSDGSRVFLMGIGSSQTGDVVTYNSTMEVCDSRSGAVVWSTKWDGSAPLRPVANADLTAIALVPIGSVGGPVLYRRTGDSYTATALPSGTTAACFDNGRLVLGSATRIALY
jgi:hypothetical protein